MARSEKLTISSPGFALLSIWTTFLPEPSTFFSLSEPPQSQAVSLPPQSQNCAWALPAVTE